MIEIKLGNAQYNFRAMDKKGIAPIRRVRFSEFNEKQKIALEELGVQLGPFQPGEETKVVLCSHLRTKKRDGEDAEWLYENADLIICVTKEDRERVSAVMLGEETAYQKFEDKEADYYVPPRHWKSIRGRYQDVDSSHYTVAGTERVYVCYKNGTRDTIMVKSLPSIEEQDYQAMINELYAISSELLMDTGSHTKVSIENVQHNQLRNMQNLVSQIETTWRRLHGNMERDLTTEYVKMPVHRIKNMTVKSLLEYRFTGNPDVHAVKYKETRNIYENRMIVQFFHRIESYLRRQKASALQSIMHAEFGYLDDFQEEDSISDKETLKKIKKAMCIWQFDTVKRELFTNTVNDTERYPMQNGEEVVQKDDFLFSLVWWKHQQAPAWNVYHKNFADTSAIHDIDGQSVCLTDLALNKYDISSQYAVYSALTRNQDEFQRTDIRVRIKNYKLLRFLYYVVSEARRDAASRNLKNGSDWVRFDINGSVELVDSVKSAQMDKHELHIYISKINTITVREKNVRETMRFTYSEQKDYLEYGSEIAKILLRNLAQKESGWGANALSIGQMVLAIEEGEKRQRRQEQSTELMKQVEQEWNVLIQRMKRLCRAKELSHIPGTRESLRCTNIFASNPKYHAMYQLMKHASEFDQEIYYNETDDIPILKLEQLYERWCLVKLVHIFVVDYGFEFLDDEGKGYGDSSQKQLYKYINQLLKKGDFKDSVFHLKGHLYDASRNIEADEMQVDIYYNHEFILGDTVDWQEEVIPEGGRPKQKLAPDFYVEMTYRGQTKHFCLDAKYRSRNSLTEEDGTRRWYSDLMTVALQKYIVELSQVQPIDGSFILHSNAYSCTDKWEYQDRNPHAYCGQSLDSLWQEYNAYLKGKTADDRDLLISERARKFFTENAQKNPDQQAANPKKEEYHYVNDNRIGSYYLLPGKDIYLRVWITMVMEHYFGIYDAMCWDCGHKVKVENIETMVSGGANMDHYVVTCPACGTAWVRNFCSNETCRRPIGKHIINYYGMAAGNNKWNRVCPECHAGWRLIAR